MLSEVDIEYSKRLRRSRAQEISNGRSALFRSLGQRSKADCVGVLRQRLPRGRPLQKIPCYRICNFKPGLAISVHLHVDRARGMTPIRLDQIDIKPDFLHAPQSFNPARILAHSAGHDSLIAHERRDVGKVRRRAPKACVPWQDVPQYFDQSHTFFLHVLCRLSTSRRKTFTEGFSKKRDPRRNPSALDRMLSRTSISMQIRVDAFQWLNPVKRRARYQ